MIPLDINELLALADAATPGPYNVAVAPHEGESKAEYLTGTLDPYSDAPLWLTWAETDREGLAYIVPFLTGDGPTSEANARYIAALDPDTVRALVTEIQGLNREIESWKVWASDSDDDNANSFMANHDWLAEKAWTKDGGKSCCTAHGYKRQRDELKAEVDRLRDVINEVKRVKDRTTTSRSKANKRAKKARDQRDEARDEVKRLVRENELLRISLSAADEDRFAVRETLANIQKSAVAPTGPTWPSKSWPTERRVGYLDGWDAAMEQVHRAITGEAT